MHGILFKLPAIVRFIQDLIVIFVLDKEVHNLTRSGPYEGKPGISQGSFYGIYVGVADSTHDLHGIVYHIPCGFCGKSLCLTHDTSRIGILLIHCASSHVCESPRSVKLCNGVSHQKAYTLELADQLAKGLAPVGISYRQVQRPPDP